MSKIDDIITIDYDIFHNHYITFNKNDLPPSLINKKSELQHLSKCFSNQYENNKYYEKKHFNTYHKQKDNTNFNKNNRLYFLSTNFTEENKTKKFYVGTLNKLTDKNKNQLFPELIKKEFLNKIFYDIIWDFIKRKSDKNYIDLLNHFDISLTNDKWNEFMDNKYWHPPANMIDIDLFNSDIIVYDLYCDFVKWKKEISNVIDAWSHIVSSDDISMLLNNLYDFFLLHVNNKINKHLIDYALYQIFIILKIKPSINIIDRFKNIDLGHFDSSSKFIIMNIIEL